MSTENIFIDHQKFEKLINELCLSITSHLKNRHIQSPQMIGIHTGGAVIAEMLHKKLGIEAELGLLDIAFYRDDFTRIGLHPTVKPSVIPFDIEDQHILLVDDVLQSGRTVRAAMNEIFDYGRPASITLITFINRENGRELPIEPNISAVSIQLEQGQYLSLDQENMHFTLKTKPKS